MEMSFLQAVGENVRFVLICTVVVLAIVGVSELVERKILKDRVVQVKRTRYLTICAMLGALAMLLHIFDFPVPFLAPGFYKLDFSEIPANNPLRLKLDEGSYSLAKGYLVDLGYETERIYKG